MSPVLKIFRNSAIKDCRIKGETVYIPLREWNICCKYYLGLVALQCNVISHVIGFPTNFDSLIEEFFLQISTT